MAKTPSETMRGYRQRLKQKGGKAVYITLSPEWIKAIELVGKYNYPDCEPDNIVKAMLNSDFQRLAEILNEQVRFREEFNASDEIITGYVKNEIEKHIPLKAEQYLARSS